MTPLDALAWLGVVTVGLLGATLVFVVLAAVTAALKDERED